MKNLNSLDQFLRLFLGALFLEIAFFWTAGIWQVVSTVAGIVLIATASLRFCPLYKIIGVNTDHSKLQWFGTTAKVMTAAVLVAIALAAGYASIFFSRKIFLEEFNAMNHFYKQTLFLTGKSEREKANADYDALLPAYAAFQSKYSSYRPYALRGDTQLSADLAAVSEILTKAGPLIRTGDLHQAHLDLEKVRPVFQEVFKRNGFSLLAVTLVDFHDAMELVLDAANAKDTAKVIALYPQVSEKLKAVEAEANDEEIQAIRQNLDGVYALAGSATLEALPAKAEALKSSFIKVYLKRG